MFCPFINSKCKEKECVCYNTYWLEKDGELKECYECDYVGAWKNLSTLHFH